MNGSSGETELRLPGAVGAVPVGSTIRKQPGPWTPTIHRLLRFLRDGGFDLVPQPMGFDDQGQEVLSWLDGTSAVRPWPPPLLRDDGVIELARFLRRYHDVVGEFDPGEDARWRAGRLPPGPGEIVCHGDFGPWNTLWKGDSVIGVIDWDLAEPAPPILDVAFLALQLVPLRSDERAGFGEKPPRAERLAVLCDAYGDVRPEEVVSAVVSFHERDRDRTINWGRDGREPWATFLREGELATIADDASWLGEHRESLISTER